MTEITGSSTNQEKGNDHSRKKRTSKNDRRERNKFSANSFKGKIEKMEGHTFVCHGETTTPSKYTDTIEQLGRYATHTYKYGEGIQLLVQTLEETNISKPDDLEKDKTATDERIWLKEIDGYVTRTIIYSSNKCKLYAVIWDQCSPSMQARMESLDNYVELNQSKDCIRLLREIKASVFEFETQAYIYDSMLKASSAIYNIK